jgi:hypothetical protein
MSMSSQGTRSRQRAKEMMVERSLREPGGKNKKERKGDTTSGGEHQLMHTYCYVINLAIYHR